MGKLRGFLFAGLLMVFMVQSPLALAKSGKLSTSSIKRFIKETTQVTSGQHEDYGNVAAITGYLQTHIADNGRFQSSVTFTMPGQDAQTQHMDLKKKDFMRYVIQSSQSLQDYESKTRVLNSRISEDGKRAYVQTSGVERGVMPTPTNNGGVEFVPFEGTSNCQQIIKLSRKDVIQMYSAVCETDVEFSAP
ncbi:MAG: hypothetical protein ACRBCT_01810 [Alphaproteobacteria bacterium]